MSAEANGTNGMPGWVKAMAYLVGTIGIPGFICLYLLGVFGTFLPNPVAAHDDLLAKHHYGTVKILRVICRGIWKDDPAMAAECDR
jgi:hypothetical protein